MANSIEVEVKLGLQSATGTIDRLRQALKDSVNIDSSSFKSINKMLDDADRLSTRLKSNLGGAFKNSNSISRYAKDFQAMIDKITTAQDSFQYIGKKDLLFDENETQKIKDINAEITQLSASMKRYEANKIGQIFDDKSIESFNQVREAAASLHVELSKTTFENFGNKLTQKLTELGGQIEDTTTKITNLQNVANNTKLADVAAVTSDLFKATSQFSTSVLTDKGAQDTRKNLDQILEEAGLNKKQTNNNFNYSNVIRAGTSTAGLIEKETQAIEKAISEQITTLQEKQSSLQKAHDTINDIMNGKTITGDNGEKISTRTNEIKQNLISQLAQQFPNIDFGTQAPGESYRKYLERLLETFEREIQQLDPTVLKESLIKKLQESTKDLDTQQVFGSQENIRAFQQAIKDTFTPQGLDIDKIESLNLIFSKIKVSDNVASTINAIAQALANFKNNANTDAIAQATEELKKLQQEREKYSQVKTTTENAKIQAGEQYEKEKQRAQELIETLANLYNIKLQVVREKGNSSGFSEQEANNINNISAAIKNYGEQVKGLESKQKSLGNIQTAVNRWMGFWQVLNMTKSAINDMKQHIQELDSVMTQISVVTNFSQKDLWGQISTYSEIARQYGVAIKGVYEVSQIYYQQGLQQNDVMTLTTETLKMARIAGLDYATAADYMTTAIRGFKLEMTDAAHVTDVFSALAATTASSTEEIATAISKTAASAQAVGASFEATSAMMATMIATTRESATNIGTALKSVISRYGEMTSDPSKTVDSEGEEMSLNRVDAALQTVGITIHDTAGQFRDFDDVILELMEKWDSLDSLSQRYIATLMAGNRQQSRFLALVSNVDEYKKALETAMDSEGAGELQTLKTLDSIDAKIEKMKVTIQEFYTSSGLEELYKNVLDIITNIVSAGNSLPKIFNKFPAQALAIGLSVVNAVKGVIQLIIAQMQMGLEQMKNGTASTLDGLIIQFAAKGREAGKQLGENIKAGAEGATNGLGASLGSKIGSMLLNYVGAGLTAFGAYKTISGTAAYGASTLDKQDQAAGLQVGAGGALGILGSIATGMATGTMVGGPGYGTIIGGVVGTLKGVIENFATLKSAFDMYNVSLARQIELADKRLEKDKVSEAEAKNTEKQLEQAYNKLQELEAHQYDSVEAMTEYHEYINQLTESYPEYIAAIEGNGDIVLNLTALELDLAAARQEVTGATINSLESEKEGLEKRKQAYEKLQSAADNLISENLDLGEAAFQLQRKYGEKKVGVRNNDGGDEEILVRAWAEATGKNTVLDYLGQVTSLQSRRKAQEILNTGTNRKDILAWANEDLFYGNEDTQYDPAIALQSAKNAIKSSLEKYIGEIKDDSILKQLGLKDINDISNFKNLDELQNLAENIKIYTDQAIERSTNVIDGIDDAIRVATISDSVQREINKLATSTNAEDKNNAENLQSYISLISFILNKVSEGLPSSEDITRLNQWVLDNPLDAERLKNIDYNIYRTVEDIDFGKLPSDYQQAFVDQFNLVRENAIKGLDAQIKQLNLSDTSILDALYTTEEGQTNKELITKLIPTFRRDLTKYQQLITNKQYAQAEALLNNIKNIYGAIGELDSKKQEKAFSSIQNLDFTDANGLQAAAATFREMGEGFEGAAKTLDQAALSWTTNAALLLEQVEQGAIDTAKAIESSFEGMNKTYKRSEAMEKAQEIIKKYTGEQKYTWEDLYDWDEEAQGYVKNATALNLELQQAQEAQASQIAQTRLSIEDFNNILSSNVQDKSYWQAMTPDILQNEDQNEQLRNVFLSNFEGLDTITQNRYWQEWTALLNAFQGQLDDNNALDWNAFLESRTNQMSEELARLIEQENLTKDIAQNYLKTFDYKAISGGTAAKNSKVMLNALLTSSGAKYFDQREFDEAYANLLAGRFEEWNTFLKGIGLKDMQISETAGSEIYRTEFEQNLTAISELGSNTAYEVLSDSTKALLKEQGITNTAQYETAKTNGKLSTILTGFWTTVNTLIDQGYGRIEEANESLKKQLTAEQEAKGYGKQKELLSAYKDGFSIEEAVNLGLADASTNLLKPEFLKFLEEDKVNGGYKIRSGRNVASVLTYLAEKLGITIDTESEEWKQMIDESISDSIAKADKADAGKQAAAALQSLVSGKLGDRIDVSKLAGVVGNIYEITSEFMRDELIMRLNPDAYDAEYKKALQAAQTDITSKRNKAIQSVISGATFDTSTAELFVSSFGVDPSTITDMVQWMGHFGFEWDGYLQQFKATADTIGLLRSRIAEAAEQGASNETLNALRAQVDQIDQQKQIDTSAAYSTIVSNYQSLGTDAITNFANAIGIGYESVIKAFELTRNGDGTYKLDLAKLSEILASGKDAVGEATYNAMLETVAGIQDNILSSITGAAGFVYQGTNSTADMQKFVNELNTLTGSNLGIENAFSYDTILNTFTLNANAMKRYADAQKAELAKLGLSGEAINKYIKDQTVTLMQQNMDIESFLNAQGTTAKSREANKLAVQIKEWATANGDFYSDLYIEDLLNRLDQGGEAAVKVMQQLKGEEVTTSELEAAFNSSQIVKLRTAISDLEKGVGETVTGLAMNIMQVTDGFELAELDDGSAVITAVGDMVQAYANLYAAMKSNADATTGDLNSTYAKLLTAADQKNIDTLETLENAAGMTYEAFGEILSRYGKSLETTLKYSFVESDGFGKIRITDFDRFASYMNFDVNSPEYAEAYSSWVDSMIELQDQPRQMMQNMADSIKNLADAKPGDNINATYIARELGWDDLDLQLVDKLKSYGASFRNGILHLGENADIPGLMTAIANEAAAAGQMIPEQLAEIADAIESMLSNIVSLLGNGLSGNLSNADAQTLSSWASQHGVELNFTKTAEGLRISNEQAYQLYQEINKIDALQGQVAFQQLKENLIATKDEFKTVSANIAYIKDLENQITALRDEKASPDNEQRIAALEEELALAKQINLERSTSADDSFNFMSNDIPAAQNNPLNYYKNWSEAIKTLNTAMKTSARDSSGKTHKGLIDYTDFYNIVTEMNNLARIGGDIKLGAYTLNGDLESAAKLIDAGAKALTTTDTGDIAVSLGDIGIDFKTGSGDMSKGIQDGIKAMADSQVEMLDGLIQLLETIVAMESLSDIDIDGNGIDLSELFTVTYDKDGNQVTDYTPIYKEWREDIIKKLDDYLEKGDKSEYVDLGKALTGIKIGGISLDQIIRLEPEELLNADKAVQQAYTAVLTAFTKAAQSNNYNLDDIAASVRQELASAGVFDQDLILDIGNSTLVLNGGVMTQINWNTKDNQALLQQVQKDLGLEVGKSEEEARKAVAEAMSKYQSGQELSEQELTWTATVNKHLKVVNGVSTVTWNNKEYTGDDTAAALAAWRLKDAGVDIDRNLTQEEIDTKVIDTTTTIGNNENIRVVSNGITIEWYGSDGSGPYTSKDALLKGQYETYVTEQSKVQETSDGADTEILSYEQWVWANYHYHIKTISTTFTADDKAIDLNTDREARDAVRNMYDLGAEQLQEMISQDSEGNYVLTYKGITVKFDKETVETDGAADGQKIANELWSQLGLDTGLADTITEGITNAIPKFTEALSSLNTTEPTGLNSWSSAIAAIGTAAETTASAIEKLVEAMKQLPKRNSGGANPIASNTTNAEFDSSEVMQGMEDLNDAAVSSGAEAGEAYTSSMADAIQSGDGNIQNATDSINTHLQELGVAADTVFGNLKTILATLPQHVSITGDIKFETPQGELDSVSGFRGENGKLTFTAKGETSTDTSEIIESVEKTEATANVDTKTNTSEVTSTIASLILPTVTVPVEGKYIGTKGLPSKFQAILGAGKATGNFGPADARGTLMGELGPELVVQDGRYFVAGQHGAEFVDLQNDAIVFNHLQTEQLLKKGMSSTRGRAVTNERTAVAFAQGNVNGGPAMASASAALAALKQLRSMWASLASASVQDLAGAGGGGGGGGGDKDMAAYIKELEKWYNWLQKIAELEDKINYQEQLRSTISSSQRKNGSAYYSSLKDTLKNLQEQVKTEQSLIDAQQKYFDKRRKELNTNGPFNSLYTFDENGQLKYKKGALNKLSKLNETDKYGKPKMSSEEQYAYIVNTLGIDEQYLQTTATGEAIDTSQEGWQATAVQAFWDKMDADKEEMQSLHDSINEHSEALLAAQEQQNEILQEMRDNQLAVEQNVYDAIVDSRERAIEDAEAMRDALEESTTKFIDGLSSALDKERSMYEMQESQTDLDQKRRRLAILQRTGGSNSEIASLQSDIASSERDLYFDKQQEQIDLIQEASDKQIEKLDQQIELDKELLEYQKAHGLLWSEVADIMKMDSAAITDFITSNNSEWWAKSPVQSAQDLQDAIFQTDQWVEFRDDQNSFFQNIIDTIYNTTTNAAPDNPTSTADSTTQLDNNGNGSNNTRVKYKSLNEKKHKKITQKKNKKGKWETTKEQKEDHDFDSKGKCTKCGYKKKKDSGNGTGGSGNSGNGSGSSNSAGGNGGEQAEPISTKFKYEQYSQTQHYKIPIHSDGTTGAKIAEAHSFSGTTCTKCFYSKYQEPQNRSATTVQEQFKNNDNNKQIENIKSSSLSDINLTQDEVQKLRTSTLSTGLSAVNSAMKMNLAAINSSAYTTIDREKSTQIGSISLNMDVKQIANDYDAKRAGEKAMEEMLRIARKSTTATVRR